MEAAVVLILGTLLLLAAASPLLALAAPIRVSRLEKRVVALTARLEKGRAPAAPPERSADALGPEPTPPPTRPVHEPTPPVPAQAAPSPPSALASPVTQPTPSADFATSIGPRILVGARGLAVVALFVLPVASAALDDEAAAPAFEREVRVPGPGVVVVRLDRHVYEAARSDLGDLRVLDGRAETVPYALDRGVSSARPERRPGIRNRGVVRGGAATAVLDFGERVSKERLALRLSGDNFRRRVVVEGRNDGSAWTTLTEEAWVFAIPGPEPARYEVVTLPANDFRRLRVTVHPGPRERERVSIEDAWLPSGEPRPRREERLAPRWSRADVERPRETWLTLDLGARHHPFHAIVLDVEDERFFREVRVEAREDVILSASDSVAPPERWRAVGGGVIYRLAARGGSAPRARSRDFSSDQGAETLEYREHSEVWQRRAGGKDPASTRSDFRHGLLEHEAEPRECLRVEVVGRARAVRLRLRNRDDRPLRVVGVSVVVPVERLLFEASDGGDYTLRYGAPELAAPTYDLARTLGEDPEASVAELGPPVRRAVVADVLPWTERHPFLLLVGLLIVVAALGAVTWWVLRSA